MPSPNRFVIPFAAISMADLPRVGGKNASLGEMLREFRPAGVRVPDGFAVTAEAFTLHLAAAGLPEQIYPALARLDVTMSRPSPQKASRPLHHGLPVRIGHRRPRS